MNLTAQQDFSKLKWRSRVLLLSTPTLSSEGYNAQMEAFLKSPKKLEDRNLLIFTLVKGKIYDKESKALPNYDVMALRKKYDLSTSYEGLVLIGKDGSTKLKKPFPVQPTTIFEAIDKMPMRKSEMRENLED